MTPPIRPEVDPLDALKALKAQPDQSDPLEQLKALRAPTPGKHDFHAEYKSGALQKRMAGANARDAANLADEAPDYATQALGGIASLAKDIPGAEAAQAGARALVRGQSYRDALKDIQGAEASAPSVVRNFNRIAGGAVAASTVPGGPALSAARYGILSGLLQSDPDADIHQRIKSAAGSGLLNAITGHVVNAGTTAVRGMFAPSSGAASGAIKSGIKAADEAAYGRAAAEGAMPQPTPPEVHQAFSDPDIAPYVEVIRNSRKFKGANDATVLQEAYKLMSERQGVLGTRVLNASDFKAGSSLENADIGLAKKQLLDASNNIMPSFRGAVQQHAEMAGNRGAFQKVSDAANRVIRGTSVAAKQLDKRSPEAIQSEIAEMTPGQATAGLTGALSRLHDTYHVSGNPFKLFGAGPIAVNASRVAPLVNALDEQVGTGASAAWPAVRNAVVGSTPDRTSDLLKALGLQ